jgi:hypothetical protein
MSFPIYGELIGSEPSEPAQIPVNAAPQEEAAFPEYGEIIGETPPEISTGKEVAKEALVSPFAGLLGAYGNVGSLIERATGMEREPLTPGQKAMAQAEFEAPEELVPWLQGEDLAPQWGSLPTSTDLRKILGVQEPQTMGGRYTKRLGESLGGQTAFGMVNPIDLAKGGLASVAGQTTEELGGGPIAQSLAELMTFAGPDIAANIGKLAKKPATAPSGLVLPKVAERQGKEFGKMKPIATAKTIQKSEENLANQSEKLINEIKSTEIPISKAVEQGIDIDARNSAMLNKVTKLAEKVPNQLESKEISDYLNNYRNEILKVPKPSSEKEAILKEIDEFLKHYDVSPGGTRFYPAKTLVDQFRDINKDMSKIYETNLVFGKRPETIKFYEGLKDAIEKTFENQAPKEFSDLFKFSNKQYSEARKLENFEKLMEQLETEGGLDIKKFSKFMKSERKSRGLKRQIGEDAYQRMKSIGSDLEKAQKNLKLIEKVGASDVAKSMIVGSALKFLGVPLVLPYKVGKTGLQFIRGYLLTSPQGTSDIKNFLKAVRSGSAKAMETTLLNFDNHAKAWSKEHPDLSSSIQPYIQTES